MIFSKIEEVFQNFSTSKMCTFLEPDFCRWRIYASVLFRMIKIVCDIAGRNGVNIAMLPVWQISINKPRGNQDLRTFVFVWRRLSTDLERQRSLPCLPSVTPHLFTQGVSKVSFMHRIPSPSLNDQLITSGHCFNVRTFVYKLKWSHSANITMLSYFICNIKRSPEAMHAKSTFCIRIWANMLPQPISLLCVSPILSGMNMDALLGKRK